MDLKNQLLETLFYSLKDESAYVLEQYAGKPIKKLNKKYLAYCMGLDNHPLAKRGWSSYIGFILIGIVGLFFYFGGEYISSFFGFNFLLSIAIEVGSIVVLFIIFSFMRFLIRFTYSNYENKFDSIKPKKVEIKKEFDDEVYDIISNTFETLSTFRKERERQAKSSFNAALTLIIAGILIVFIGVYLLYKKNITEGSLTSGIGAISNILGGTIIKFYKNTNNRMDQLNNDLFILNSAKVQYAMILKIRDSEKRDFELSELIKSIGRIKSTGYNRVPEPSVRDL